MIPAQPSQPGRRDLQVDAGIKPGDRVILNLPVNLFDGRA
jgi:hypothetical protein